MASPKTFDEADFTWKGWPGNAEEGVEEVLDLPVAHIIDGGFSVSCWSLDAEEISRIVETGEVWLSVAGHHPPIAVSALKEHFLAVQPEATDQT